MRDRLAVLLALAAMVAGACGGGSDGSDRADGASDPAAATPDGGPAGAGTQALEAVVLDYVAPVSGESTRNLVRLSVWIIGERNRACEIDGAGAMRETDRYDQVGFPDFDRIAEDGIGLVESLRAAQADAAENPPVTGVVTGPPVTPPAGPDAAAQCVMTAIPELAATDSLRGAWMRETVEAAWATAEAQRLSAEATDCLRERMSLSAADLPGIHAFFAALDGTATHLVDLPDDQEEAELSALDQAATAAFLDCTPPFYDWLAEQLAAARPGFVDQHREAIQGLTSVLDARGYTP